MKRFLTVAAKTLQVCAVLFLMLLLLGFVYRQAPWLFGSKPIFRTEVPLTIELFIIDWKHEGKDIPMKTIDLPASCTRLIEVMQEARSSSEHQCVDSGSLMFHYRDGQSLQVGILPGHHKSRYEFRYDHKLYSLPRSRFLEALESSGIDISKIPQI